MIKLFFLKSYFVVLVHIRNIIRICHKIKLSHTRHESFIFLHLFPVKGSLADYITGPGFRFQINFSYIFTQYSQAD